jgi:hypothetical protein
MVSEAVTQGSDLSDFLCVGFTSGRLCISARLIRKAETVIALVITISLIGEISRTTCGHRDFFHHQHFLYPLIVAKHIL